MPVSNQNHDTVVVGVTKEGASADLIRKVRDFSRKAEVPICLVHALEEKLKFPSLYREILGSFDISELNRERPDGHEKEVRDQIEANKALLLDQENIRVQVVHAEDVAASLIAEAQLTRASLIAIEVDEHLYKLIPRGLSVALSLMQHAPMPALILRHGSPNRFDKKNPTIIVADDLSAASMGAVRKAMNLAAHWGHTEVIHLHVIEQNMHGVIHELAKISRTAQAAALGTPELLELLEKHIELTLQRRTAEYQDALRNAGSSYRSVVQVGHVANKIAAMIHEKNPDLTVFGRRQRLHPGPFGFSRVPFAAMLANSDAVLIVP